MAIKVKLHSNLQGDNGSVIPEGNVVELADELANHLIEMGAAEPSDADVSPEVAAPDPAPGKEAVDPKEEAGAATIPLENTQPAGDLTPKEPAAPAQPASPATPTTPTQQSSSTDLHLG